MLRPGKWLLGAALLFVCAADHAQTVQESVQKAVNTELEADAQDHTHWLYYEVDLQPGNNVEQWVAQTSQGSLKYVVERNGQKFEKEQQRQAMDEYINDPAAQAKARKSGQNDDRQAARMLRRLPDAFIWTKGETHNGETVYHFKPNPDFTPATWQARVFAAMAGDMTVDDGQHRIAMLKGTLIHDVKFFFGIFGNLLAGGTFSVQRQQLAPGVWQITQAHIHIQGHALIFKSISEQEDDVKWKFKRLPDNLSLAQAEKLLLEQNDEK
ncbi:MAG TPA: hypothetical protein VGS10_20555 [Terracidiphilus sp.]|nr:hypothetical protein [Terracidiphilus sp.]